MGPLKKDLHGRGGRGRGRGGRLDLLCVYERLKLSHVNFYVFHERLKQWEVVHLTKLFGQVGPLKKDPHGRGGRGRGERLDLLCFTRV